jgi:hypothetical protein
MNIFTLKRITSIALSAVVVSTSMLLTASSSAASSADQVKTATPTTELAYVTNHEVKK